MAKTLTEEEMYQYLQAQIDKCGTQKEFAVSIEKSPSYISDVMKRRRSVIPIAKLLGYEIVFRKSEQEK